jgi:deoxyribose-phosphate aldolase
MSPAEVAALIDHSLLKPTLTLDELEQGCRMARAAGVASVCVLPHFVPRAADILAGSNTRTSTVIAFPHGALSVRAKVAEAAVALADGAVELDAVVNLSWVLSSEWQRVGEEIQALADACHARGAKLKWIFETCALSQEQKVRLCALATAARVDWVKTSTGFGSAGATAGDVRLLREHCPPHVQVKASGGIGSLREVLEFQRLGATRIGTSRTEAILREAAGEAGETE